VGGRGGRGFAVAIAGAPRILPRCRPTGAASVHARTARELAGRFAPRRRRRWPARR
jgi:hypothetical protein